MSDPKAKGNQMCETAIQGPPVPTKPCCHDSIRQDGTLNNICLRCGVNGYWHDGHRHDEIHPSGKGLIRLDCADCVRMMERCSVCGADPGEACTVVCGGPSGDSRLDGTHLGEKRPVPHYYR